MECLRAYILKCTWRKYISLMYAKRLTAILRCYLFRASQAWGLQGIMCTDRAWSWRLSNGCMGIPICTFHFTSSSLMVVSVAPNTKLLVFSQQMPTSVCSPDFLTVFTCYYTKTPKLLKSWRVMFLTLISFQFLFWPKGPSSLTHSPLR